MTIGCLAHSRNETSYSVDRLKAPFSSRLFSLKASLLFAVSTFSMLQSVAFADSAKLDFNGHSYQRFDTGMSWTSAKAFCETKGAHLATVTSQAEHDFIANSFAPRDLWLGASDAASEGNWTWVTGEPWAFTNWYPGEPNNFGGVENYLVTDTSVLKKWNDVPNAGDNFVPLCEWDSYGASQSAGDQFSPSSNPNGTWSYGYKTVSSPTFQLFDNGSANARGIAGMYGWNASALASEPHVYFNSTASAIGFANTVNVPPRSIQMHPGPNEIAVVRWTAPASGIYTIEGAFRGNDTIGGSRIASIQKNGVEVFSGSALASGQLLPFNTANAFTAGDTLDFMVDPNGPHQNDSTGLTLTIANINALPLTQGLVAHYVLDGNANDTGTNAFNGTPNGNVVFASGTSWASFNPDFGGTGYVEAAAALNRNTSFSVGLWVRPRAFYSSGVNAIMFERQGGDVCGVNSAGNYGLTIYDGSFAFETATLNASSVCSQVRMFVPNPVLLNAWTHLTAVYESGTGEMRLYVGGALAGTTQVNQALRTQPGARLFLGRNPGASQPFLGDMSDVRIYDRVLSNSEISALASALPATNGRCGTANGVSTATPPAPATLCTAGTPSTVTTGAANYVWACTGANGGTTASCSAPITPNSAVSLSRLLAPSEDGALFPTKAHGDGHIGDRMSLAPNDGVLLIACSGASCPWTATTTQSWIKLKATAAQTQTGNSVTGVSTGTVAAPLTFSIDAWEGIEGKDPAQSALITVNDGTATLKTWRVERQPLTDWDEDGVADEWEQRGYPISASIRESLSGIRLAPGAGCDPVKDQTAQSPFLDDLCVRNQAPFGVILSDADRYDAVKKRASRDIWLWADEMLGLDSDTRLNEQSFVDIARAFSRQGITLRWKIPATEAGVVRPSRAVIDFCTTANQPSQEAVVRAYFENLKQLNFFAPAGQNIWRDRVYRYMLYGTKFQDVENDVCSVKGNSGFAWGQWGVNGFVIASEAGRLLNDGGLDSYLKQTATIMHELGHDLGLGHGGPIASSGNGRPYQFIATPGYDSGAHLKANYPSLMNYRHQLLGLKVNSQERLFDYSSYRYRTIDETSLTRPNFWDAPLQRVVSALGVIPETYAAETFVGTRHACDLSGIISEAAPSEATRCYVAGVATTPTVNPFLNYKPSMGNSAGQTLHVTHSDWDNLVLNLPRGFFGSDIAYAGTSDTRGLGLNPTLPERELPSNAVSATPYQVRMTPLSNTAKKATPGQVVEFSLRVTNDGMKSDVYDVVVRSSSGLAVQVTSASPISIGIASSSLVSLRVTVPSSALAGAQYLIGLRLISQASATTFDQRSLSIETVSDPALATPPENITAEDRSADDFSFSDVTGAPPDTYIESNAVILGGFSVPLKVQVLGGEMSINGGDWTNYHLLANPGDTLRLRTTSSPIGGDTRKVQVAVGGLVRAFDVKTILTCSLDINGDSSVSSLSDAILIERYLMGFRGDALTSGLTLTGSRSTGDLISNFLGSGASLDVFGRSTPVATLDGLVLIRLMQGIGNDALLNGITIPDDAQFTTAPEIRAYVNSKCGTSYTSP